VRYRERSAAERTNARLKDELAAAMRWSRGTPGRWSNAPHGGIVRVGTRDENEADEL